VCCTSESYSLVVLRGVCTVWNNNHGLNSSELQAAQGVLFQQLLTNL
jgi:hypothetical protein